MNKQLLERVRDLCDLTESFKDKTYDFRHKIEDDYDVDLFLMPYSIGNEEAVNLDKISIPKERRKQGIGSKIMQELINFADSNSIIITLTPSTDYGGSSVQRLKNFYKKFGFIENKGRNKDFRFMESMVRYPNE